MKPIGIFDSGIGGLTVFNTIAAALPQYDYIYLGDNSRAPYGNRSFNTIHQYTWECVQWLFKQGCPLIILACNTASAKALRTIQQKDMQGLDPALRVLGVIRPTAEIIGNFSNTKEIAVLGTTGTVQSGSYLLEIQKFFPDLKVYQQACPLWVPMIESGEYDNPTADYIIKEYLDAIIKQSSDIDTLLLACTHYPIIKDKIIAQLPSKVRVIAQGDIVAESLADYLKRHPTIEGKLSKGGTKLFYTTDDTADFDAHASVFFNGPVTSRHVAVNELACK